MTVPCAVPLPASESTPYYCPHRARSASSSRATDDLALTRMKMKCFVHSRVRARLAAGRVALISLADSSSFLSFCRLVKRRVMEHARCMGYTSNAVTKIFDSSPLRSTDCRVSIDLRWELVQCLLPAGNDPTWTQYFLSSLYCNMITGRCLSSDLRARPWSVASLRLKSFMPRYLFSCRPASATRHRWSVRQ